tara:strand:+ start:140 stop:421 length:282 start_codon:yes stop_codon:yes gene_type:complete
MGRFYKTSDPKVMDFGFKYPVEALARKDQQVGKQHAAQDKAFKDNLEKIRASEMEGLTAVDENIYAEHARMADAKINALALDYQDDPSFPIFA